MAGLWREKAHKLVVIVFVEKSTTGSKQRGSLGVQTGESVNQAKVFRAHAVPWGLCGNLLIALKLLANQQEMASYRNIVTNLCEARYEGRKDAQSRGSGDVEVIHQCRPHGRGEVGSSLR